MRLFLCTAITAQILFCCGATHAQTHYSAPKAEFELVKKIPDFEKFTNKFVYDSGGETEQEVSDFFSDETEIFVVKTSDPLHKIKSIGKFDTSKSKIEEIGHALGGSKGMTLDKIRDYHQYVIMDGPIYNPGTFPGYPGRVCWQAIVSVNDVPLQAIINKIPKAKEEYEQADVRVTREKISVHFGSYNSKKGSRVIETISAKVGVIYLKSAGNGVDYNAKILTPGGKIGYIESETLISAVPSGYCFAKQKNGQWLIDAIIRAEK